MPSQSFATRPIQVLLVDQTPGAEAAVRAALAATAYEVVQADNVGGAGEPLSQGGVDIVLLAVNGSTSGLRQVWLDIPVLAIVDAGDPDAELRAMEEGALDWLARDELDPAVLPRAIRYVLDRHRLESELQRMAHVDPLTGLRNRRYLMKQLDTAVGAARRHGYPLSVCVCDIDYFKLVNDAHGHLAGDEVLRVFATLVSQQLRREDEVARFGGDEFCLMFPHINAEEAARAVERIRLILEEHDIELSDGTSLSITATFGLAEFVPDRHVSGQALFDEADQALYEGKERGRNQLSPTGL